MCPPCAVDIKREREEDPVHPEWCRNCAGYQVGERRITHRREWVVGGSVAVRVDLSAHDDGSQEAACLVEELWDWTPEEGRQLAMAITEAADLMEREGLRPEPLQ